VSASVLQLTLYPAQCTLTLFAALACNLRHSELVSIDTTGELNQSPYVGDATKRQAMSQV
jgi:hypothetical protein